MKKPVNLQAILIEALITLALIIALYFIIRSLYNSFIEKKSLSGDLELSKNTALNSDAVNKLAKKVPANALKKATEDLSKFDPKPIGEMIVDANGNFSNNVPEVYMAFGKLKNQRELAYFANFFKLWKKIELMAYLNKMNLKPDELDHINTIIKDLPLY